MSIKKHASAKWQGGLKDGTGSITTESGALQNQLYGFNTRFEDGNGTNPEELIGAAHAGCFSMALSKILGEAGMTANSIETKSTITLEEKDGGFAVTKAHLATMITVSGGDATKIEECAHKAKEGCPVSKLLNAEITLGIEITV